MKTVRPRNRRSILIRCRGAGRVPISPSVEENREVKERKPSFPRPKRFCTFFFKDKATERSIYRALHMPLRGVRCYIFASTKVTLSYKPELTSTHVPLIGVRIVNNALAPTPDLVCKNPNTTLTLLKIVLFIRVQPTP